MIDEYGNTTYRETSAGRPSYASASAAAETAAREEIYAAAGLRREHASLKKKDALLAREVGAAFERLEKMSDGVKEMALEIAVGEKEITGLHGIIATNRAKRLDVGHLKSLAEEYERLDAVCKELSKSHDGMTEDMLKMESGLKELRTKLPHDEEALKRSSAEAEKLAAEKTALAGEVSRLEEAAGVFLEMEKLRAETLTLEKELGDCTSEIEKAEKNISGTEPIVAGLRDEVKRLSGRLRELEDQNREIIGLKAEIAAVEKEIAAGRANNDAQISDILRMKRELTEKSGVLAPLEKDNLKNREQNGLIEGETGRLDQVIAEYADAVSKHAELVKTRDARISGVRDALMLGAGSETVMVRLGCMMRSLAKDVGAAI
jgi:myosin heavy subunit